MLKKLLQHPLSGPLLILILGTLAYANSFGVPFVLDDLESITGNQSIRDLGNFLPGGSGYDFHFRRSVVYFTFALNHHFGGLSVFGYHLFNLAVHLGTALLVYLLLRQAFRTPVLTASRLAPHAGTIALLAALFFVVHPVQTQAVTYIVQRLTSLCTFYYLLALVLYAAARLDFETAWQQDGARQGLAAGGRRPLLLLAGSFAAAVLAMFAKEIAFTLPLAAFLFETCFFRGAWRQRLPALLPLLLTLPIIPVLVFSGGELSAAGTLLQTRVDIPRWHYLLTQLPVIVTYLRLLVLPVNQNLDYDYPLYTTFFTPPVFISFLLLAGIVALALALFRVSRPAAQASRFSCDPALRVAAFGIAWFFLTLSVESSIVPLADVIFEHRLYLPSIGLSAALAVAVVMASQKTMPLLGGRLPLAAAAVAIALLGVATWQRNQVWRSEVRLWEDTVSKSPEKARPLYNLGTYLGDNGRPEEAVQALTRVVALDPRHADAWHNLGRAYLMLGRTGEAVPALETAVRLKPEMENAVLNLTVVLIRTGKHGEALDLLEKARRRFPDSPGVHLNLGLAYLGVGNYVAAKGELDILQRLNSSLADLLAGEIKRATLSRPRKAE